MYAGSMLMHQNVLEDPNFCQTYFARLEDGKEYQIDMERGRGNYVNQ